MNLEWNADLTRCAKEELFGIALYVGGPKGNYFEGVHVGCVGSWADALRWLEDQPVNSLKVYPT